MEHDPPYWLLVRLDGTTVAFAAWFACFVVAFEEAAVVFVYLEDVGLADDWDGLFVRLPVTTAAVLGLLLLT